MYMLGRRRTCSRPSRTWICSALYATSAPRDWGLRPSGCAPRAPDGSGERFGATFTGESALPAWRTRRGQLGRGSGLKFYRISNSKMASGGALTGLLRGRFPTQDGVLAQALQIGVDPSSGGDVVEASDGQVFGLVVEALGVGTRLSDDLLDGLGESVQRRFALGLGRFDHDRLGDHEREVDRGRVEVAIEQGLGDVQGPDALVAEVAGAGHEFVHARPFVGHIQVSLHPLAEVVGRKHGVF